LSTACGILERVVGNTLASAKKCVQNFEYIIQKNTKHDPEIDTSVNTLTDYGSKVVDLFTKRQPRKSLPVVSSKPTSHLITTSKSQSFSQVSDKADEILEGVVKSKYGSFECPQCPYTTNSKQHLKIHFMNHFPRDNTQTFKCKYCNYYLANEFSIKNHEKLHINQNKESYFARCDLCPYKTTNSANLIRHKKNHEFKKSENYFYLIFAIRYSIFCGLSAATTPGQKCSWPFLPQDRY
jgi:ferredoxin-thioredoxin reductase catalytic subunit